MVRGRLNSETPTEVEQAISIGDQSRFSHDQFVIPSMPLPIDITALLSGSLVESERVELKEGWNPESVLHTLCAFANDFHNLGGGYVIVGVAERDGHAQLPPAGLTPEQIDDIQKESLNLRQDGVRGPVPPDADRGRTG